MASGKNYGESSWRWTNERHLNFLNTMEDSFVRSMLDENNSTSTNINISQLLLPLDRYVPDTSDSTLDLHKQRRRRHSTSDILEQRGKTAKKATKLLSRCPENQVVPQFKPRKSDDRAEEKRQEQG